MVLRNSGERKPPGGRTPSRMDSWCNFSLEREILRDLEETWLENWWNRCLRKSYGSRNEIWSYLCPMCIFTEETRGKMTHSVNVGQFLSLCGFPMAVNRIDMVAGMPIMHGLSNMDFHLPRSKWQRSLWMPYLPAAENKTESSIWHQSQKISWPPAVKLIT